MIRAVIFDMDGVVVDSEELHQFAEQTLVHQYGAQTTPEDWQAFIGRSAADYFRYVKGKYHLAPSVEELVLEKRAIFKEHMPGRLRLFPDFTRTAALLSKKYRLALTTSSTRENVRQVFSFLALDGIFEITVTADDVKRTKPDPEPYALTVRKLGLKPAECVVVEDATNGLISGRAAGCSVIGVTTSFPRSALVPLADRVISRLAELPAAVASLEGRK